MAILEYPIFWSNQILLRYGQFVKFSFRKSSPLKVHCQIKAKVVLSYIIYCCTLAVVLLIGERNICRSLYVYLCVCMCVCVCVSVCVFVFVCVCGEGEVLFGYSLKKIKWYRELITDKTWSPTRIKHRKFDLMHRLLSTANTSWFFSRKCLLQ